jgi:hypothetical protein
MSTAPLTPAALAARESVRGPGPGDLEELVRGAALGEDEVLVVTTETRQSIGERVFLVLFVNVFSVGFTVYEFFHPAPDPTFVYSLIALDVLFLAVSLFLMVMLAWGTWFIDLEGVTFEPCYGSQRCLRWSQIERVQWSPIQSKIQGQGVTIPIFWHGLTEEQAPQAYERVEKILADDFDLRWPRPPLEAPSTRREQLKRWAIVLGPTLALAIPWAAITLVLAPHSWRLAVVWLYAPLAAGFAAGIIAHQREMREFRRVHPAWPWRTRQTKAAPLDW